MKNSLRWLYPFFGGIILFNMLRVVTDFTKHDVFWAGDLRLHLISICFTIFLCYFYDIVWRRQLSKIISINNKSVIKEYLIVTLQLSTINIVLVLGQYAGIFYMGSGWIDYMLINVCFIPFLLIYYTLIRNEMVNKNYQDKMLTLEKLKADKSEAELKFLKSQYHPHFLFNALNTIYFQIDEENQEAKHSIEKLSDLLRYQLYDIEKEVTLEQEINYLQSYIAFQQLRMSDRLVLNTYFDPQLREQKVHPLLFQPLIENAFKYVRGEEYRIKLEMKLEDNLIRFYVENTVSQNQNIENIEHKGIGINNLKRRLYLLYPNRYSLDIEQVENLFVSKLTIKTV
ncbi:sensor histidine kinase [Dysgonomonas macrotermitis]|uniref:Histidine kinase n=1 Tax=Dysgonomonas macrotermitis TaxID=1346286 RepID=A0A1M5AZG0_9BACT|nr:histidine kinase [Dysgonomonas macrotermitis]SHF35654.1 Histidine kinase [Dysgonomonas macrotermitis]